MPVIMGQMEYINFSQSTFISIASKRSVTGNMEYLMHKNNMEHNYGNAGKYGTWSAVLNAVHF